MPCTVILFALSLDTDLLEAQIFFLPHFILSWQKRFVDAGSFNFFNDTQSNRSVDFRIG